MLLLPRDGVPAACFPVPKTELPLAALLYQLPVHACIVLILCRDPFQARAKPAFRPKQPQTLPISRCRAAQLGNALLGVGQSSGRGGQGLLQNT